MEYTTYETSYGDSNSNPNLKDKKGYYYKKSSYQYSSKGDHILPNEKPVDHNIDQLDALLEDLEYERRITKEKDILPISTSLKFTEAEKRYSPETSRLTNIERTNLSKATSHSYNSQPFSYADNSLIQPNSYADYTSSTNNNNDSYIVKRIIREDASDTALGKQIIESRTKFGEVHDSQVNDKIRASLRSTSNLATQQQDLSLTGDILPQPGTKVTTTVRTYTYEVPANSSSYVINQNTKYNTNTQYDNSGELRSLITPQTVVYNTESYSTTNKSNELPIISNQIYEIEKHREYNSSNTNNVEHRPAHLNKPLPNVPQPVTTRYFNKETSNTVTTINGPNGPNGPNVPNEPHPVFNYNAPGYSSKVTEIYDSHHVNKNHYPSMTNYRPPLASPIQPAPFPTNGVNIPVSNEGPPQKMEDLMQSFGNLDRVDKSDTEITHRKRELETSLATPNHVNIPSINRAGKEVYYPPGHEKIISKHEEYAAGSSGGGRWARGAGMYEYESGSKSKTKTKTGGAMVPVCLPLCCAMPCSIM